MLQDVVVFVHLKILRLPGSLVSIRLARRLIAENAAVDMLVHWWELASVVLRNLRQFKFHLSLFPKRESDAFILQQLVVALEVLSEAGSAQDQVMVWLCLDHSRHDGIFAALDQVLVNLSLCQTPDVLDEL